MSIYVNELECCGVGELHGIGSATPNAILGAVLEAQGMKKGRVIATSIARQRSAPSKLERCGFSKLDTFKNPNTGSTVTMWMRSTELTEEETARAIVYNEANHLWTPGDDRPW